MTRTGSVEPAPSVQCFRCVWVNKFPSEGYGGVQDRGPIGAEFDSFVCQKKGGEEEGEEEGEVEGGGTEVVCHPAPHNGEGRGITLGENLEEEFVFFFLQQFQRDL